MASEENEDVREPHTEADIAQVFKELQKGEQTATAMENHLDALEKKIEELLAQAERVDQDGKAKAASMMLNSSQNYTSDEFLEAVQKRSYDTKYEPEEGYSHI